MNREARGSSGGGWKALAIFLAIVLVAAGILIGVFYARGNIQIVKDTEEGSTEEKVAVTEDGTEIGNGETIPMQNIIFRTARTLAATNEETEEYATVTLTGTLNPEGVAYTSAVWSADWTNDASEWASGKDVSDYITVTQTEENELQASVACLQPIGEQVVIKLTVSSENTLSAECTVDFAQRVTGISLKFGDVECDFSHNLTRVPLQVNENGTAEGGAADLSYTTSEVYTVADSFIAAYTFEDPQRFAIKNSQMGNVSWLAFCDYIIGDNSGYDYSVIENYSIADNGLYFGLKFFADNLGLHYFYATRSAPNVYEVYENGKDAASWEDLFQKAMTNAEDGSYNYLGTHLFDLKVTLTGTYSTYTNSTYVEVGSIVNTAVLSDVEIDEGGIIF